AVAVFIVTCPCALSLATPAAMLAAAGALARGGVLVRNLQALEALAGVDTVLFDKTGTLTRDRLALRGVLLLRPGWNEDAALAQAVALARHSLHPVARALAQVAQGRTLPLPAHAVERVEETPGMGLCAGNTNGTPGAWALRLGSADHCGVGSAQIVPKSGTDMPRLYLADADGPIAGFVLEEDLRPDAHATVAALKAQGLAVQLLSGDYAASAQHVAAQAGIAQAQGGCTPQDKLAWLRAAQAAGHRVVMVGDGLNDGPVIAGADVSFAFGQAVPLAQARADFVVPGGQLARIAQAVALARRTLRVVRQNLAWAAVYNALCVPLAFIGWLPAWLAGLGMALSSLLVVLNAARLARPLSRVL
ncbi:MAG TPA: HAD-IC family P-type ATPase, partial [Burkholderiaceae bacterium]